ncbi:M15 family peptidase [Methylobacterium brachiatum]|nr:M15 family peptidase [Methylobacterium brachiatum]
MRVIKRAQQISAIKFHIHEGVRTMERQKEMVERGWSKTLNSKHLTGRAVDLRADGDPAVGDLDTAKYTKINEAMKKAAEELKVPIQWGGDSFGKFKDVPHFQLPDGFKSEAGAYAGDSKPGQAPTAAAGDQAKMSALQAQRAGAQAAIAQANAAQAATVSSTSNDNRSTSTSETKIGQINIHTAATDASGIARDIGPQMKRHAFAAAANYARA